MPKIVTTIGYGLPEEIAPGIHENVIKEKQYYGDVKKDVAKWREGTGIHADLTPGNQISIIADPFAFAHYFGIRYVEWMGTLWTVTEVLVQRPRLVLRLGGVYNGPTPEVTDNIGGDSEG